MRSIPSFWRPMTSWASLSRSRGVSPAWRWMRSSTAFPWPQRSRGSWQNWASFSASFSEAVKEHPELVRKYWAPSFPTRTTISPRLNSAVFSDGSFVYVPKGVRCPMELSTYFRINARNTGQFERTLIIADEGSLRQLSRRVHGSHARRESVARGGRRADRARQRRDQVLHRAELVSRRQKWKGGIYNFVTKRGKCAGVNSKISWTQVETGSAITWKYPGCILLGDNSVGEFYSVALTNNYQQADTGTKMIHIGKNTSSTIVSKGISAGHGQNSYRGLVKIMKSAENARNFSQCDSLLIGDKCGAHTFPYIEVKNPTAQVEHEARHRRSAKIRSFTATSGESARRMRCP